MARLTLAEGAAKSAAVLAGYARLTVDDEEYPVIRDAAWRAAGVSVVDRPPGVAAYESACRAADGAVCAQGPHALVYEARPADDAGAPVGTAVRYVTAAAVDAECWVAAAGGATGR
eukprot:14136238-Alexandrium_andersonii.AAC.1